MKKLIPLLLASAFIVHPVFAQTAEAPKMEEAPKKSIYSPIMPVKIKPRQGGADEMSKAAADIQQENKVNPDSLGLYARISDGGLGTDVWKNYTSSKLAEDLGKLDLNISSPTFRSLLLRALLTSPDTEAFADDTVKSEAFSSRVKTLIDLGSFDETVLLYKKLEGNIPSATAALAGAEAIVSSGQMGLACLEEKALSSDLKQAPNTSFWPDLSSFCTILLTTDMADTSEDTFSSTKAASSFAASKKLVTPSALSELNSKSIIEILAMKKAGLLKDTLFTPESVRELKPQVISLLLKQGPTGASEKLSLLAVAAEKGIASREEFETAFLTQSKIIGTTGYWTTLLNLHGKIISSTTDELKTAPLKEVLKLANSSQNAILIPFANILASLKNVEGFSSEEARKVVSLLIRSKTNVSGAWFAQAFGKPDAKIKESITDMEVISALQEKFGSEKSSSDEKTSKDGKKPSKTSETIENAQLHAISLILNAQETEDKINETSYEKLLSLTGSTDYVMPSMELTNNLTQASSRQDTGKVILYSLQILNGQRVSQIHPSALFRISEGLQSVGLSEENRSLAHEVLADVIEYKN